MARVAKHHAAALLSAIGPAYNQDVGAIAAAQKDRHDPLSLDHLRLGASKNSGTDDLSARLCRRSRSNFL